MFDSDDFDDAFSDDLDRSLDPETVAAIDGASADAFAGRKARLTRALVGGETGVQFESLALFAEPLFALYDLDAADAFRLRSEPEAVADDTVALLETARVLWAFFSMPPAERAHKRPALAAQLVGEDPSEDDWVSIDGLLETAEIHWQALLPEEVEMAQDVEAETLGFDALLHHPAFRVGPETDDATTAGFGDDSLSEVEARALFAQPLLESPDVMSDPDAFEDALTRADDYWALARSAPDDEAAADRFADEHAATAGEKPALRDEALRMLRRYRELFPDHAE